MEFVRWYVFFWRSAFVNVQHVCAVITKTHEMVMRLD